MRLPCFALTIYALIHIRLLLYQVPNGLICGPKLQYELKSDGLSYALEALLRIQLQFTARF
jgi:hypothetical protein